MASPLIPSGADPASPVAKASATLSELASAFVRLSIELADIDRDTPLEGGVARDRLVRTCRYLRRALDAMGPALVTAGEALPLTAPSSTEDFRAGYACAMSCAADILRHTSANLDHTLSTITRSPR